MNIFDLYIIVVFLLKICFIVLAVTHIYYKIKGDADTEKDKKVLYWKQRTEFVFIALMSILLIYLFNPNVNRLDMITNETKLLLFLFGFVLLITADWDTFIKESKLFIYFQQAV